MKKLMMTLALAMTMSMAANAQVNPTGCQQKKECCKKQGDKKDCKMAAECKKQCDKKQCDKKQCDKKQCDKKAGTCCKKQEKK